MNKQEFEKRIRNSANGAEIKSLFLERINTVNEEFAPHGPTSVFEICVLAAVHKLHYEALYNNLPPELKKFTDNMIMDSTIVCIAEPGKETR